MEKRPALGKGLSALIPDAPEPRTVAARSRHRSPLAERASSRAASMDDARLDELAQSIKSNGVIQPIVVRKVGDRFQIIAGERRWRAAQQGRPAARAGRRPRRRAGAGAVAPRDGAHREHPAREPESDRRSARVPPADRRVPPHPGTTSPRRSERTARRSPTSCGCSSSPRTCAPTWPPARSRWAMPARCSRWPDEADQRRIARDVIARSLSVRETESLVRRARRRRRRPPKRRPPKPVDVHTRAAEDRLRLALGHARPHRPAGRARADRDRLRVGGRADPASTSSSLTGHEP